MADEFKTCSVDGCNGSAASLAGGRVGFCANHYQRLKRHGDPLAGGPPRGKYVMKIRRVSGTRLYVIWSTMLVRCGHRPGGSAVSLSYYRDSGIRVCDAWLSLDAFVEWANANGYSDGLTIDRINNDLGYEPSNCRWVPKRDNSRHCRSNKISMEDAREIRRLRADGFNAAALGSTYGVTATHIRAVVRGQVWAE